MAAFITPQFGGYYDPDVYSKPAGFVGTTEFFDPLGVPAGLGAPLGLGTSSLLGPLLAAGLLFILASRPRSSISGSTGGCTASGYTIDATTGLCYRLYKPASPVSITAVRTQCQSDGGKVLLVDNAAKLNFAQQQAAAAAITILPINGERADDFSSWNSFEGNALTFYDWNTNEPTVGDRYIGVSSTPPPKINGIPTSLANSGFYGGYICQIP